VGTGTATAAQAQAVARPAGVTADGSAAIASPAATRPTVRHASCHTPVRGGVHCLSLWHRPASQHPITAKTLSAAAVGKPKEGFGPADIRSAYKLPTTGGTGQMIAIVDAFDNPNAEKDLAAYRAALEAARLHHGQQVLPQGGSARGQEVSGGRPGLGSRDRARPPGRLRSLFRTKSGGWTEDAWWGAGSGCSAWVTKPAAQKDINCDMRTVADVSVVADPDTGFAVYDTYGLSADNGWIVVGGTSLSAPLLSGMIGLAGNAKAAATPAFAYAHRTGLKDVVGGSNGYCGDDYLCTGVKGYDAPTGLGVRWG
jgi:hypothetical protein